MRATLILLTLLASVASASAEPYVTLVDWTEGESLVGVPVGAPPVASSFGFEVDECHRQILVDLLYAPANRSASAEGVGEVVVPHAFRVDLVARGATLASRPVREPGYGTPLGIAPEGPASVRLQLEQGALVGWSLRVRGHELACGEPL